MLFTGLTPSLLSSGWKSSLIDCAGNLFSRQRRSHGFGPWILTFLFSVICSNTVQAESGGIDGQSAKLALAVDSYSNQYDELFRYYSNLYFGPFVDWRWFKAQAVAESRLISTAMSNKGATGLMQLLPSTFQELEKKQPYNGDILEPRINIAAGMMYDRTLYRKWNQIFNGEDRFLLMLASYNAGFYRVYSTYREADQIRKWEDIKGELPSETRQYVRRIRELMQPVAAPGELVVARVTVDLPRFLTSFASVPES